jgi:hypothetical protein
MNHSGFVAGFRASQSFSLPKLDISLSCWHLDIKGNKSDKISWVNFVAVLSTEKKTCALVPGSPKWLPVYGQTSFWLFHLDKRTITAWCREFKFFCKYWARIKLHFQHRVVHPGAQHRQYVRHVFIKSAVKMLVHFIGALKTLSRVSPY